MPNGGYYDNPWFALGRNLRNIGRIAGDTRRERRDEALLDEERGRERRAEYASDLAQPGAMPLPTALDTLNERFASKEPLPPGTDFRDRPSALTPESLSRVGRAEDVEAPISFRPPPPEEVKGIRVQEAAPRMTGSGVVIDPQTARHQNIGRLALQARDEAAFAPPEPWQPMTREEQLAFEEDKARRTGLYGQRTRPPREPQARRPVSYADAVFDLGQLYGDPANGYALPPWVSEEWRREAIEAIRAGEEAPPLPPPPTGAPISAAPPRPSGLERFGRGIGRFLGGLRESYAAGAPSGDPGLAPQTTAPAPSPGITPRRAAPTPSRPTVTPEERDSAQAGGKIPVTRDEYDAIIQEQGEGYARQHFVVR